MNRPSTYHTTRLVWLLAGIGLATGAVTLAIVGTALWIVMRAQTRHDTLIRELGHVAERSRLVYDQARTDISRQLRANPPPQHQPAWLAMPARHQRSAAIGQAYPAAKEPLERIDAATAQLQSMFRDCRTWADENAAATQHLRTAQQRSETALFQLRELVADTPHSAAVTELEMVFLRLLNLDDLEGLAAAKDDQLLPAARRLLSQENSRDVLLRERSALVAQALHGGEITPHGPVAPSTDSLYGRLAERLKLLTRQEQLRTRSQGAVAAMQQAVQDLRQVEFESSERQAVAIGKVFQQAWRAVLWTGAMALGFLLVTCWKLPKALSDHIEAIRQNVGELEAARHKLKAQNIALEQAQKRAEAASRGKSEFLALVSHEFRTPLTAVLGYADVLLTRPLAPDAADAVRTIQRSGQHLLSVVNDIMDLSRIEAGRLDVHAAPCSPTAVLREIVDIVQVRGRAKGLGVRLLPAARFPAVIVADALRLRQIVINLAATAIELTEDGEVRLAARCNAEPAPRLEVEVFAPGIGLKEDQIERLFEPFAHSAATCGRGQGDIGLGLSIGRRLAVLLGGEIRVTSDLGGGTMFRLTLPVSLPADTRWHDESAPELPSDNRRIEIAVQPPVREAVDRAAPPVASYSAAPRREEAPATGGLRVLVAEDGPDNQLLIATVLRRMGAEIELVSNGAQAAELAMNRWRMGCPYDVILMDMQMPVLDGYQATRRLREAGYDRPIIALTAHAMSHDRQKCLDAGCTDYSTKPLEIASLQAMIRRHTAQPEPQLA